MMERELEIGGMSCQHCVHAVHSALAGIADLTVKQVRIGSATVEAPADGRIEDAVRRALDAEGYELISLG